MDPIDIWLRAWILALSTALFVVSALAYSRERDRRMLIAAGLFLVFLVKGVILMLGLFSWDAEELVTLPWFDHLFDVAVLLFVILYVWHIPHGGGDGPED
ncbi:MAG: hypothetical protein KAT70_05425 [Thermoplasmata archaeon]|nr:hypothetical protein [Thermoplasmata archaeon]